MTELSYEKAAAKSGVSTATFRRWLRQSAFRAAYCAARRSIVEGVIGRLQNAANKAVDALERNLACGSPSAEIKAATAILDHAFKGVELLDLAERLAALENPTGDNEGHNEHESDQGAVFEIGSDKGSGEGQD